MSSTELNLDHEVRVRVLESISINLANDMKETRKELISRMDTQFHWVIGTIIAQVALMITLFGGIILHLAKLN